MSNYEKYLLTKENALTPDTIYKTDTVYIKAEEPEYDDLYFTSKKTELKLKQKELRLEKKKLRILQDSLYYDAKEEVYEDLYYTSLIYRFHSPFSFSYYGPYWRFHYGWYSPFWIDPWYYDSWCFGWEYSYHNWYYPRYYDYWHYPHRYYWYDWRYRPYYVNNYYSVNSTDIKSVPYGRRDRQSTLETFKYTPVTINRTVEIDRRSGKTLNIQTQEQRRSVSSTTVKTNVAAQNQNRRNYIPAYTGPKTSTRPQYNNTITNRRYESNDARYNYTLPTDRKSSIVTTPRLRTYSTPNRNSAPSSIQNRRSSSYSTPNRSSYLPPSRGSGSYGGTYNNSSSSGSSGTRRR